MPTSVALFKILIFAIAALAGEGKSTPPVSCPGKFQSVFNAVKSKFSGKGGPGSELIADIFPGNHVREGLHGAEEVVADLTDHDAVDRFHNAFNRYKDYRFAKDPIFERELEHFDEWLRLKPEVGLPYPHLTPEEVTQLRVDGKTIGDLFDNRFEAYLSEQQAHIGEKFRTKLRRVIPGSAAKLKHLLKVHGSKHGHSAITTVLAMQATNVLAPVKDFLVFIIGGSFVWNVVVDGADLARRAKRHVYNFFGSKDEANFNKSLDQIKKESDSLDKESLGSMNELDEEGNRDRVAPTKYFATKEKAIETDAEGIGKLWTERSVNRVPALYAVLDKNYEGQIKADLGRYRENESKAKDLEKIKSNPPSEKDAKAFQILATERIELQAKIASYLALWRVFTLSLPKDIKESLVGNNLFDSGANPLRVTNDRYQGVYEEYMQSMDLNIYRLALATAEANMAKAAKSSYYEKATIQVK